MTHADSSISTLGVIAVHGADASTFLRAQLTNDVFRLGPDRNFLAAWCDARGRTLLITRVAQIAEDDYRLILPAELLAPILNRLRMYVLRAQVEVADVSADYRLDGLMGAHAPEANRTDVTADSVVLGLPETIDGTRRALSLSSPSTISDAETLEIGSESWLLAQIDAGIPAIVSPTQGLFVPQMLNLHWLMAVDFDKGCYPGQEVVARLQHRGRLTQRVFRLAWSGTQPDIGAPLVDGAGNGRGTVLASAAAEEGSGRLLGVVKINAIDQALYANDAPLTFLDMPYATPA